MDCREELQRADAEMRALEGKLADQLATIERFRAFARKHDATEEAFTGCVPLALCLELDNERIAARAAITANDMGEAE